MTVECKEKYKYKYKYNYKNKYVANSLSAMVTVECKEKLRQLKDAVVREFTPNSSVSLY